MTLFLKFSFFIFICLGLLLNACGPRNKQQTYTAASPQSPSSDEGGGNGNGGEDFTDDTSANSFESMYHFSKLDIGGYSKTMEAMYYDSKIIELCDSSLVFRESYQYYFSAYSGKNLKSKMLALVTIENNDCLGFAAKTFPNYTQEHVLDTAPIDLLHEIQYPHISGRRASLYAQYVEKFNVLEGSYENPETGSKILYFTPMEYAHSFRITLNGNLIVKTDSSIVFSDNRRSPVETYFTLLSPYKSIFVNHLPTAE